MRKGKPDEGTEAQERLITVLMAARTEGSKGPAVRASRCKARFWSKVETRA